MSESFDAFTTDKWLGSCFRETACEADWKLMEGWSIISRVERIWTSLIMPEIPGNDCDDEQFRLSGVQQIFQKLQTSDIKNVFRKA